MILVIFDISRYKKNKQPSPILYKLVLETQISRQFQAGLFVCLFKFWIIYLFAQQIPVDKLV
jgi:hypothetical protein